ncbi:TonB-dependent receptor [Psychrosphaera sp. B3R10]|uniref:TonB-dependent receptor n=1 Tax=unclassified Psychrosphaera TaxID=2641570 RepID=UPI001C08B22F|nr:MULTISPECIES: TonB-dependent receptor [unclassified Psychrosphaera]MBU2883876.1 TonB-dependent receptor [Psychrosphaera sp. I2R16]MBU2988739.1 TonB-dependent receptor [Psychrosphaera sp. B3R10]
MKLIKRSALGLAVAAALNVAPVMADETSSAIRGVVTGNNGSLVTDAVITILHEPTGRVTTLKVNEAGNFNAKGLRVGGPYKIVIDSDEYKDSEISDVYLQVGKTLRLSPVLNLEEMETITVTGARIVSDNRGGGASFGLREIESTPSVDRDLKEVLRLNPLVNIGAGSESQMSIAGSNPKYNSFSVDGVRQNDDFGLNGNGYPTQRSPISIDAVEQVSVNVTPFSVTNSGFSGGQVNAVTKSGTNEFHGSIFIEKKSDALAGDVKDPFSDEERDITPEFSEDVWGFTVGGPIIKDKLFFFTSYEKYDATAPIEYGPDGSSAPNSTDATVASYNEVVQIAKDVYGVDAGNWEVAPTEEDEKFLLKLDWNINEDHRVSATYQHTTGNSIRNQSSSGSELRLSSHWYNKEETLDNLSVHLYSDWTMDLSTEFKIAFKNVETIQASSSKAFGDITVATGLDSRGRPAGNIAFGSDQYRHGNELDNQTLSLRFAGEYLMGDHVIGFGIEHESIDVRNLFAPDSLGRWEFDSIEDFRNKEAAEFFYSNAYSNDSEDAAAKFNFGSTSLFIEDAWAITSDFEVTAGLRYETIHNDDKPAYNENFDNRYSSMGIRNDVSLDGLSIILPRISFVWDVDFDTVVRGGIGRFSGGRPNVWISNAYSNDGVTYTTFNDGSIDDSLFLSNVDIKQVPTDVQNSLVAGDGNVNVTDPDFEMPSDLRTSISIEHTFDIPAVGEGFVASAEFIHVEKENDVHWVDLTRKEIGTTADGGRIIYEPIDYLTGERTNRYDLMLTNADKNGTSDIFTTSLFKAWDNGVTLNMSYTIQDITEGNAGASSTAKSNFRYVPAVSRNVPHIATSDYEIEHRFVLNLGYTTEFFAGYDTKFNLFFERKSGSPYSYTMGAFRDGDLGDQSSFYSDGYYLPYIPTGADDPNVIFDGISYEDFAELVEKSGLSGYAGGYVPKNVGRTPWRTRMDLHVEQEVPGFMKGHKGSIYFDVKNLLNLFDEDSGLVLNKQYQNQGIVDYDLDDQGRYVYDEPFYGRETDNFDQIVVEDSAWLVKVGIKYRF